MNTEQNLDNLIALVQEGWSGLELDWNTATGLVTDAIEAWYANPANAAFDVDNTDCQDFVMYHIDTVLV